MKTLSRDEDHLESIIEYQDKMYLPGYYVGGKIHPVLKAKSKAGGYALLTTGVFLLIAYSLLMLVNFTWLNLGWLMPMAFAVLLIIVGIKFIRLSSKAKA